MNSAEPAIEIDPASLLEAARTLSEAAVMPASPPPHALKQAAGRVRTVPALRLTEEMTRVLLGSGVHEALQWLYDSGILDALLPELAVTVNFSQEGGRRHKDVWEHTKQVVRQSVPRPSVRWAALLHDIGKVPTRTFTRDGKVHFHGHAEVGARMFDDVARRFAFDPAERKKIRFLILHHLRANQYLPSWTDSAVRRFGREMGPHLVDLLDLSRADITSKRPGRRQEALASIHQLAERMEALAQEDAKMEPLPTGLGTALMEALALPPSKRIGELKGLCEAAVERGEIDAREPADYYIDWLRRTGQA